jgi:putative flippase GtrA
MFKEFGHCWLAANSAQPVIFLAERNFRMTKTQYDIADAWHKEPSARRPYRTEAELIRYYGSHSLAFFGLSSENLRFLAPNGEGLVSYRLVNNVAVVLDDPVCAPEDFERVTRSFLDFCRHHHWHVAFYQAHYEHLATYHDLKLRAFKMGEEAIIDLQIFTLSGSAMANVRTSCRRAEREGVTIDWYEGVPPAEVMHQLEQVSNAWLQHKDDKHTSEMGFSMGRLDDLSNIAERAEAIANLPISTNILTTTVPRLVTAIATTSAGRACAFVTFTPIYGLLTDVETATGKQSEIQNWGWSLDLMRRVPDAPPGVIELLLVRTIELFRSRQAQIVSLGMVAMADTRQETSSVQRRLADFATNRLGMLEGRYTLFNFKQKFHPDWESRYFVTDATLALPKVALAVSRIRHYSMGSGAKLIETCRQFLRYCLVGGANTLIDLLILNILLWRLPTNNLLVLVIYNSIAYSSGAVSSFFFNKYWTFGHKRGTTRKEIIRFVASLLLEVLYSNGLIWLAGKVLRPLIANDTLWANASKLVAVGVGTAISYMFMRFWIFAGDSQDQTKEQK